MSGADRSSLSLVSLSSLDRGVQRPQNDHLAFVGPLAPELGTPVCAFSEVDVTGYATDPMRPNASGAGQWATTLKTAAAIGIVFGGLLGGLAVLIAQDATSVGIMIALVVGLFALFTFLFRPKRVGWSAVVGTEALQFGTVNDGRLDRTVFPYGDSTDAWFEEGVNVFTRRPGMPTSTKPTRTEMRLIVRARDGLEQLADMGFVWSPRDVEAGRGDHRSNVYFALAKQGFPRRVAEALARLERGETIELPTLDGATLRILPARTRVPSAFDVELVPRVGAAFPIDAPIAISCGVYTLDGGGRTTRIERGRLGDAFVLDALCIAPTGTATSAETMSNLDA